MTPSLPVRLASHAVRMYLRTCPVERGKFRLWRSAAARFLVTPIEQGLWLRTSGLTEAERSLFMLDAKEPRSAAFVRQLLQPGMVTMDVGANIGYFTLIMAARVGATGRVHAFEPTPVLADRIRLNAALNGLDQVTVKQAAVSAEAGTALLHCSGDDFEANSLFGVETESGRLAVETVALDAYARAQQISRVDFIKIDCEGSELNAMKGAADLLRSANAPAMIFECNPATLAACGASVAEMLDFLRAASLSCYNLEQLRGSPDPVWNVLAVKSPTPRLAALITTHHLRAFTAADIRV